ncbi:unnamed protein product [Penicillium glandicola]
MAWWDSSRTDWLENLVPTYAQEILGFRAELEAQIETLIRYPGHQRLVSVRLVSTARSMRKIKTLASDISVYFPNNAYVAGKRPGFFQTTFPRLCDFIEKTLIELNDPESQGSVAWQLQDMLDSSL